MEQSEDGDSHRHEDFHVPPDLASVADIQSWCSKINASPEAVAVWAYEMYKLARIQADLYHRLSVSLAYMGFDQFKDEYSDLWKCVLSGKSTIPIQPDGTLMPCGCLASVPAMSTYTEAALCPNCRVPFSKSHRVEKEAARKFSELTIAMDLAQVPDDRIESVVEANQKMLKEFPEIPKEEMPFQHEVLTFKGGHVDAKRIRALAILVCKKEREYLTQRARLLATHALKDLRGKYQQMPPIPRNTAQHRNTGQPASSELASARPAKRIKSDVNFIPSNERVDEPMPEGVSIQGSSISVGGRRLMPTKFAKKCPQCPTQMIPGRTLLSCIANDEKKVWVCSMCAIGMTSADAYAVSIGKKPNAPSTISSATPSTIPSAIPSATRVSAPASLSTSKGAAMDDFLD